MLQHSCRRYGSGAFGERLFLLKEQENRIGDLFFVNRNNIVHISLDERKRYCARATNCYSIRDRYFRRQRNRCPLLDGRFHRRKLRRLNTDHADFRIGFLDRAGDAGDQTTAADGDDEHLDLRLLFEHLKAKSSLPGDYRLIVERMNKRQTQALAAAQRFLTGFVVVRARKDHFRTVSARGGYLYDGRRKRHANLRSNSPPGCVIGDGLGMVTGRGGDHALEALLRGQQQNLVKRSPLLVGAGDLEVFEFEENRVAGQLRKCLRTHERRQEYRVANPACSGLDRLECNHKESAPDASGATLPLYTEGRAAGPENVPARRDRHPPALLHFHVRKTPWTAWRSSLHARSSVMNISRPRGLVPRLNSHLFPARVSCYELPIHRRGRRRFREVFALWVQTRNTRGRFDGDLTGDRARSSRRGPCFQSLVNPSCGRCDSRLHRFGLCVEHL